MSTDAGWMEAFRRVSSGKSSYRGEAKGLGTSPATFQRRYLDYLESRVGLVREEHTKLEGAVASTKEKLEGLTGKYNEKDQKLAVEYARKKRAAEAEFQAALNSLKAKTAGEETRLRESLTKQEQEGERRLKKLAAEVGARNAVISEFKKRGLEPTKGLELLKKHEDLRGELSRKEGLLERVSSSIEGRRKQQRKEEIDTASRREAALKMWNATLAEKKRQMSKLDQQNKEIEEREKRLKAALHAIGDMINVADRTLGERRRQVQDCDYRISQLQDKFARLEQEGNDKLKEIAAEGQRKKSALRDEIVNLEREREGKREGIRSTTETLNSCRNKIARIEELLGRVELLKNVETERVVEEIRKGVQERVTPILEKVAREKQALADQTGGAEVQRIRFLALATRLGDLEEKLKSEAANTKRLGVEVKKLSGELKSATGELESLKKYKVEFVDGRTLTLEETKKALVETRNDEIEKRTDEKFQKLKTDYETRMPQLIHERLIQILKKPHWPVEIANVINAKAEAGASEILHDKRAWPVWFIKYYTEEVSVRVNRLLDDEFDRRVDEKSQKIAVEKLEGLKSQAWPDWFSKNVKPVIDRDIFKALGGSWAGWRCDKCGTGFGFTLTEHDIGVLLGNGRIEFTCPNSNCIDRGLLGWRSSRHKIRITLERLIARMMEGAEVTTAELAPAKKAASVA